MKNLLILFILFILLIFSVFIYKLFINKKNKKNNIIKIISNAEDLREGIYGQCLTWLLEVLYYLEKNNIYDINNNNTKVIFDINTLNNKNLIPKFIQPKKIYNIDKSLEPIKISFDKYKSKNKIESFDLDIKSFEKTNKIFNKYFKFNDFITNEVNKLNISENALGIHFRGSDKLLDSDPEANYISKEEMILIIQDYIKHNNILQIFCCSDEQSFVTEIIKLYPNKVIQYKQKRLTNSDNNGLHRQGQNSSDKDRDNLTNSCIIDMLALSKCATIIKSSSALSSFSKIINPSVKLYTVSATLNPWFPTPVAEQYKSKSEKIIKILERTMKNDSYNKL